MDQRFLNYYRRELLFMREIAADFAAKHPKIAKRLNITSTEIADPWIERLIDSFCFLNARTQLKIDAEFEPFTQRLLNSLSPEFTLPTPAKSVVQIHPSVIKGDLTNGYRLAENTPLLSQAVGNNSTRCEFRTRRPLTLWPMVLQQATLTKSPPELTAALKKEARPITVKSTLTFTLTLTHDLLFSQLMSCDEIPIYISGDEHVSSHLFELIACHYAGIRVTTGSYSAIFSREETGSLLPPNLYAYHTSQSFWQSHHGYRYLKEFFDFRSQFYFFSLVHLAPALRHCHSNQIEISILLDSFPVDLAPLVTMQRFHLHCVPVVNLFPGKVDRIRISPGSLNHSIVVDRSRPADYEVGMVRTVSGFSVEGEALATFYPLYQRAEGDRAEVGRYFSVQRTPHLIGPLTEPQAQESDVWLSLVDQSHPPYSPRLASLHVDALVSNRYLPQHLPLPDEQGMDLQLDESIPACGATFAATISQRYDSLAYADQAWKLINLLQCSYQPLDGHTPTQNAEHLRERLRLFLRQGDDFSEALIHSVVGLTCHPIVRRLSDDDLLLNYRGVQCQLTVDEGYYSNHSPFLFGHAIALFLATHSAVNSFVEVELLSLQRGLLYRWPASLGRRGVL
ncbi:type VI secretion system baseplate subunit TssF [Rosenbergiella australiborealis]|uniref:Type VI secretion system baseplate subunit TssF n=1 Tax=Rosenbergiella australiborealis TaxID=1544696 RepID=A0ABS5T7A7_9GAMM|nr:type VI secretion system baseplate subunit TssF [Rosenbergiella australiborealis]MBT0728007.1 type VI secretion system baseplate subunit TssF [Rosenbergiella australiborealis]